MKKVIILGSVLACLAGAQAANATDIVLAIGTPAYVEPVSPVVIEQPVYPVHVDHHHRYDWRYWNERHDHGYDHR